MKYELAHDTIARQVFEKASAETKARRQVRLLVDRALERYRARGVLLTADDLDEIRPFEHLITFDPAAEDLIRRSRKVLEAAARRRRRITAAVMATLAVFLAFALWQWQAALHSARAQQRMRLALQASRALDEGWPATAFRLAERAYAAGDAPATLAIIDTVLRDLEASGLVADLPHQQPVTALDFSAAGNTILTASRDGTVKLWDTSGTPLRTIIHGEGPVNDARFVPAKKDAALLSAGDDGTVRLWDAAGKTLQTFVHPAPVRWLKPHAYEELFLTVAADNHLRLFDLTGSKLGELDAGAPIIAAEFSPRGDYLLLATANNVMVKAIAAGGRVLIDRFEYTDTISAVSFIQSDYFNLATVVITPSGLRILNNRGERDTLTDYRFLNDQLGNNPDIIGVTYSHRPRNPQPKILFTFSDTLVKWWTYGRKGDAFKPVGVMDFAVNPRAPVTWSGFSANDRYVATASGTNWVEFWDLQQGKTALRFKTKVLQAIFSPDDHFLVTVGPENCARLWNLKDSALPQSTEDLIGYFQQHLRPFTPEEKDFYQVR